MASNQELIVKVTANIDALKRGMSQAASATEQSSSRMQRAMVAASAAIDRVKQAARILATAAVAAGAAFAAFAARGLKLGDELAKASDRLGVTTEALTRLRHAASQSGSSAQELDRALLMLQRNLNNARQGTGTAKDALETLNLSIRDLINLSPDQQFRTIADAISKIENPTVKAGVAMELFGRQGGNLITVLNNGAEGLDALAAEADKLGISINRIDAAKIEAANDAIDKMQTVLGAVAQRIAVQLAPLISFINEEIIKTVGNTNRFGGAMENAIDFMVRAFVFLRQRINDLQITFQLVRRFSFEVAHAILDFYAKVAQGIDDLLTRLPGISETAAGRNAEALRQYAQNAKDSAEDAKSAFIGLAEEAEMLSGLTERFREFSAVFDEHAQKIAANREMGGITGIEVDADGDDKTQEALDKIRERFQTEIELLAEKLEMEQEILQASREQNLINEIEYKELLQNLEQEHANALVGIHQKMADDFEKKEQDLQKQIVALRQGAVTQSINLLNVFGQKSRAFAIAAIVLEKAQALAQIFIDTRAAQVKALAIYGPTPQGFAAAKTAGIFGAIQAAAVVATGLGQLSSASSGGQASASNPGLGGTGPGGALPPPDLGGQGNVARRTNVTINLGDSLFFSANQVRNLIDLINEAISDGSQIRVGAA